MSNGYSISKTSFLKFEQCHKAFFLYKNHPYLRDKVSVDKQLTFKRGHDVGYFAQQLFPGGSDVSKMTRNAMEAVELTKTLIENKTPVIYEATFLFNGVLIMLDILCRVEEKFTAYEVKSSLRISENYLKDAYLQYYVLKNTLPGVEDLFLVSLNPDYVLEGEVEVKKLFRRRSVREKAEENFGYFEHQIRSAHELLEKNAIPNIAIGKQCFRPYQCDYFGSCWKDDIHENSIFNLPLIDRNKLFEWHTSGLKNIDQITDEMIDKDTIVKIKNSFITNEAIINRENIRTFLSRLKQPAIAMDMEIWSSAIPQIQGTKCFEQVPFLVCFYDGVDYTSYFAEHKKDDRFEFAKKLIELSAPYATVIVYDKGMEVNTINNLINRFPELKTELEALKKKLLDIFEIFLDLSYYHPSFKSNFSLKVVSSILLSDVTYSKIGSGLEAMSYYEQYRLSDNELEKQSYEADLVTYCNTDCLATYKLLEFLKTI